MYNYEVFFTTEEKLGENRYDVGDIYFVSVEIRRGVVGILLVGFLLNAKIQNVRIRYNNIKYCCETDRNSAIENNHTTLIERTRSSRKR